MYILESAYFRIVFTATLMRSSTVKNEPFSPPIKKINSFSGFPAIDQAIAGLSAGAISTLALHPIDLVKTKMQADGFKKTEERRLFGRAKKSFQTIVRTEGILGLYRGLSPNLFGSGFSWAFYFAWYSVIKQSYSKELGDGRVSQSMTSSQYMLASAEAGALTVLCTNPIWVVKTRIFTTAVGSPDSYKGLSDGLFKIARLEGIRGLYKGLIPALFGTSHGALQFMAYEELKRWRANHQTLSNNFSSESTGKLIIFGWQPLQKFLPQL